MGRRKEERKGERRAKTKGNQRERGDITVDGIGYSLKNLYPKLFYSTGISRSWDYISFSFYPNKNYVRGCQTMCTVFWKLGL